MIALLYIPFCVFFAWLNDKWIAEGKRIYHALNGAIHITAAALVWFLIEWNQGLALLFIARVVFDSALNLFRGLPVDYVSPEVKSYTGLMMAFRKGKVIDYVEYKLFGNNGYLPKIIYALIIVILLTV